MMYLTTCLLQTPVEHSWGSRKGLGTAGGHKGGGSGRPVQGEALHGRGDPASVALVSGLADRFLRSRCDASDRSITVDQTPLSCCVQAYAATREERIRRDLRSYMGSGLAGVPPGG